MQDDQVTATPGITKFHDYFSSHMDLIGSLPTEPQWRIIKQSLYVMVIDSIAKVVFPSCRQSGARFRRAILDFGDFPQASYFCLPHLQQHLRMSDNARFNDLATRVVYPEYEKWTDDKGSRRGLPWIEVPPNYEVLSLDADLREDKILEALAGLGDNEIQEIKKFQHCSRLYAYRSFMIHSLWPPGLTDRGELFDYPYYEEYGVVDPATNEKVTFFLLVYSIEFIRKLAGHVLENASTHLLQQTGDPYERMQKSTALYWDDRLNQKIGPLGETMLSFLRRNSGQSEF